MFNPAACLNKLCNMNNIPVFLCRAGLGSLVSEDMKIPNKFVGLSKCTLFLPQMCSRLFVQPNRNSREFTFQDYINIRGDVLLYVIHASK